MADVEINMETTNPQELIGLGIRAYAIGDFSNAAAAFGRATQLMAEKNGDEHDSLGEIYIHYARSLLEVSREESGPLGDAIPRDEETSESEEDAAEETDADKNLDTIEEGSSKEESNKKEDSSKEEIKEKSIKEETEEDKKKETSEKKDEEKAENGETVQKENGEIKDIDKKGNGEAAKEGSSKDETQTNGESAPQEEEEQPENCTDLQLAWEVLEVAKNIFKKRGTSGKDHLAETLLLLGEVAMESENFEDGINDIKAGIEMQKEVLEPTSRKLAESYYKLGIAQSTVTDIDGAVDSFNNSIEILKNRIKFLKESITEKTESAKNNRNNEEIEEMEKLIPEIEDKIADMQSIKEEVAIKLLQEMAGAIDKKEKSAPAEAAPSSSSSKARDISHLVKRKRKTDDEPTETEAQPAKKPTP